MTIPTPAFTLVDECPGWCTMDHRATVSEPGDHQTMLAACSDGSAIYLFASPEKGPEVSFDLPTPSDDIPATEAAERLTELARAALTAVHRLDVIESAEKSVSGSTDKEPVSYSLEFPDELLPLTPSTLRLVNI